MPQNSKYRLCSDRDKMMSGEGDPLGIVQKIET